MLARIKPDLRVAAAHCEAVDRRAFEAGAEAAMSHALAFGGPGDEVVVALHRVGREIGDPQQRAFGIVADRQRASVRLGVIAGVEAEPVFAVGTRAGSIVGPAVGIGRCPTPRERDFTRVADRARHAAVDPLEKVTDRTRETYGKGVSRRVELED